MNKEFLINIIILITINILVKPIYLFGVETHVQNLVGLSEWGIYAELFSYAFLFQIIHEPGIQSYNSKNIAQYPEHLSQHFPNILGVKIMLAVLFLITAISGFFVVGFDPMYIQLLGFIAINQFLATFYLYLRSNIASIGKYRLDSFISALDKILMLLIVGFLAYYPYFEDRFQIIWMVYGQLVSLLIACSVAMMIIVRHLGFFRIDFSWDYLKNLLKMSMPFAMILLFMSIYTRIDAVMLGRILDDGGYENGIYGACYRILDAMNVVGYLFAALLLPMFASQIKKLEVIESLLNISLRAISILVIIGALTVYVYRVEIIFFLYDDATIYFTDVLGYLVGGFVMVSTAYIFGTLLVAQGNLRKLNMLYFSGIVINVLLNLYMIPRYKAEGAASATLITQFIMTVGQIVLCLKVVNVKIYFRNIMRIILFGVLCALIFYGTKEYLTLPWIITMSIGVVISLSSAIVIKMIEPRELIDIVKQRKQK